MKKLIITLLISLPLLTAASLAQAHTSGHGGYYGPSNRAPHYYAPHRYAHSGKHYRRHYKKDKRHHRRHRHSHGYDYDYGYYNGRGYGYDSHQVNGRKGNRDRKRRGNR